MIDFPANPVVNQTFAAPNGVTYKCTSADPDVWTSISTGTAVPEAPADAKLYGRKDMAWSEITKAALGLGNVTDVAAVAKAGDTMTGPLLLPAGTVAAPALAWSAEPALGWHRSAAATRSFAIGGQAVEVFSADATNLFASLYPRSAAGNVQLTLCDNAQGTAAQHQLYLRNQGSATAGYLLAESLQGGATPARPLTLGFPAGISTAGKLTVNGDVGIVEGAGSFRFGTTGGAVNLNSGNGFPAIQFSATGTDYQLIHVRSSGDFVYSKPGSPSKNLMTIFGNEQGVNFVGSVACAGIFTTTADAAVVFGGNQLTQYVVQGDPGYGSNFQIALIHVPGQWAGVRFIVQNAQYQFTDNGQARATVTGGWAALVSDARVKERIEDYTPGLDEVLKIRPRVFSFRSETGHDSAQRHVSLIAQEALEALPDTVEPATIKKLGSIEHDDMLTFNMTNITYALVNAVKTLNQRINQLENA